jgi:hypothetical protein
MRRTLVALVAAINTAPSAADVLTFDDLQLPAGSIITNQYAARGVILSPLNGQLQLVQATGPLFPQQPIGLAEIPFSTSVIVADFPTGASSAGAFIDFGNIGAGVQIQAFDGPGATGNLVGSASVTSEVFLGVSAPLIRSIRFSNVGSLVTTYLIDNLTFVLIPAPSAAGLLMTAGFFAFRRRR